MENYIQRNTVRHIAHRIVYQQKWKQTIRNKCLAIITSFIDTLTLDCQQLSFQRLHTHWH